MSGPLADLYPVVLDAAMPYGVGSNTQGYFALTQLGQRSLLTRLGETEENQPSSVAHVTRLLLVCRGQTRQDWYRDFSGTR